VSQKTLRVLPATGPTGASGLLEKVVIYPNATGPTGFQLPIFLQSATGATGFKEVVDMTAGPTGAVGILKKITILGYTGPR
jgi:hypothetical protein